MEQRTVSHAFMTNSMKYPALPGENSTSLNICMKNIYWIREYVENPDQLGSPLGSPVVLAISRQPRKPNDFRSQ